MKSRFIIYIPTDTREAAAVSFNKVAGVPLFLRTVLSLHQSGEKSVTIIAPVSHRRQLLKLWQKIIKNREIHLNLVFTKEGNRLGVNELKELKEFIEPSAFFVNANYVLPNIGQMLTLIGNTKIGAQEVMLMKPTAKRSAIIGIGVQTLDQFISGIGVEAITIDQFISETIDSRNHHYIQQEKEDIIVEKFYEIKLAEELLAENIRKNTPNFVAREINKRISLPISLFLAKMRVTPNTITIINIFIGLCAGIGAAGRTYQGVLLGAILFQLASIVDGCDGEVAKLTFRTSKFGQLIDSLSDNLSLAAFLIGTMIRNYRLSDSYLSFLWGGLLILAALLILAIMSDYLKRKTDSASFVTYDKEFLQKLTPENTPKFVLLLIRYFKIFFKKDFFSMAFLVFAILGILQWWCYFLTFGAWVGVAILFYLRRQYK